MHHQISRIVEARIANGLYRPGELLPSEPRLCEEFGVSRITVQRALTDLAKRGLLKRFRGRGTVVCDKPLHMEAPASTGYLEEVLLLFATTTVKGRKRESLPAPRDVASQLNVPEGTPVVAITRWRTSRDAPLCISTTYVEKKLGRLISDKDLASSTFIAVLEQRLGEKLSGAHQVFYATKADRDVAEKLGMPAGSPVLGMTLTYYVNDDRPVAYTRTQFRADRYEHHIRLGRVPVNPIPSGSRTGERDV